MYVAYAVTFVEVLRRLELGIARGCMNSPCAAVIDVIEVHRCGS